MQDRLKGVNLEVSSALYSDVPNRRVDFDHVVAGSPVYYHYGKDERVHGW